MGILKSINMALVGGAILLGAYTLYRNQKVVCQTDNFGNTTSVKLRQFGLESTLVPDSNDPYRFVVKGNGTLDSACDSISSAAGWAYAKISDAYGKNKDNSSSIQPRDEENPVQIDMFEYRKKHNIH